MDIPAEGLKLSLGCGRHTIHGWYCIDAEQHPKADRPVDMISDVQKIALPDACASEIIAIHIWEHLPRYDCEDTIAEWRRLLRVGGRLTLEMPDLLKCCQNVISGFTISGKHPDQFGMWGLYGQPLKDSPKMQHLWGWTPKTLRGFLKSNGFTDIVDAAPQWHKAGQVHRDMRMEARKAANA